MKEIHRRTLEEMADAPVSFICLSDPMRDALNAALAELTRRERFHEWLVTRQARLGREFETGPSADLMVEIREVAEMLRQWEAV